LDDLPGFAGKFEVHVKLAMHTYELEQLRSYVRQWDCQFGCSLQEDSETVRLLLGDPRQVQLVLCGRKTQTHASFEKGKIDGCLREETLFELIDWIANVQQSDNDTLGLVVSRDGQAAWPMVIRNGEIYDESRMMDILWDHYAVTRVKEARLMETVYHFLRDVPKQLWAWIPGAIGNFFFLQPLL
jgi:hypothetical protein